MTASPRRARSIVRSVGLTAPSYPRIAERRLSSGVVTLADGPYDGQRQIISALVTFCTSSPTEVLNFRVGTIGHNCFNTLTLGDMKSQKTSVSAECRLGSIVMLNNL